MNKADKDIQPAKYVIRVKNHLDFHWEQWFEGMSITYTEDGETILYGDVVDQSALHGFLDKIRNLNLTLISVQKVDLDKENIQT